MVTNRIEAASGDVVRAGASATMLAGASRIEQPTGIPELLTAVARAASEGALIRPAGAGHSLSGLADGPAVIIDLTRMRGLVAIDGGARTATFLAGTTVDEAAAILDGYKAEMLGQPAHGAATLAGAVSTGAHGFAPREGSLSANLAGLRLVTPAGRLMAVSARRNAQLWPAARLALGSLGIVAEVTVRIRPRTELRTSRKRRDIDRLVADLAEAREKTDFYRVDWRPNTDEALLTVGWREEARRRRELPTAAALPAAPAPRPRRRDRWRSRIARALPFLAPLIDRAVTRSEQLGEVPAEAVARTDEAGAARPFVEYLFPQDRARAAVDAIRELTAGDRRLAAADVRLTLVAADDLWLSAAYGRDVVAVAVTAPERDRTALETVEDVFLRTGGLPNWGGLHTITGPEAAYVMPRYSDFRGVRSDLDPYDRMQNAALRRILG